MNESQMKKGLRQLGDDRWVAMKLTDEFVDDFLGREREPHSDELKQRFALKLRIRFQDAAIQEAKRVVDAKVVPFGKYIGYIREVAKLKRSEVGDRLGKGEDFVQRVELGDVSPVHLSPADFVDLIVLFQIKIEHVAQMIDASLHYTIAMQASRNGVSPSPGAIRHDQQNLDAERAMDAFESWQRRQRNSRHSRASKKAEACLTRLRNELARRGRIHRLP